MLALPAGGQVSSGQASIFSGTAQTTVNQTSERAVIDWSSFNVNTGEKIRFVDPNASDITLNRVNGSGTSTVNGQIVSNGNVWLINPNGVLFGKNAQVNTGGMLATTSAITNSDFMAGNYRFAPGGNPNASVTNDGSITVAQSGLAALVAPNVVNSGTIEAKLGKVQLGSGDIYTIDLNGDGLINLEASPAITSQLVANHGIIKADGGTVTMTAAAASSEVSSLINLDGLIEADTVGSRQGHVVLYAEGSNAVKNNIAANKGKEKGYSTVRISGTISTKGTASGEIGGTVDILGDNASLLSGALIDASGNAGGGAIHLGGAFRGGGTTPTALNTTVQNGASLFADALESGNGGNITIWSDGTTNYAGTIEARGGRISGNGGYAEVSGHGLLNFTGNADLGAPSGKAGTLLLDPQDLYITADGSAPAGASGIAASTVQNLLASEDVILSSTGSGSQDGNITVASALGWTADHILSLDAYHSLLIGAPITVGNLGKLILITNDGGSGGTLSFPGGNVTFNNLLGGLVINGNSYTLVNSVQMLAQDIAQSPNGFYAFANHYDASADGTYVGAPIPSFGGTFEGLGNSISNLTLSASSFSLASLFGDISSTGFIENIGLTNVHASGAYEVAGLAGFNAGTISQSYATGTLTGTSTAGSGDEIIGGLVGANTGLVERSFASVAINSPTGDLGGLVGLNGLINQKTNAVIEDSYASGTVSGTNAVSGFNIYYFLGGLTGWNEGVIARSYSTAAVTGAQGDVGGLTGVNASFAAITDSFAAGKVQNPGGGTGIAFYFAAGGLAGENDGIIRNSFATSPVMGAGIVGGLAGENTGTIDRSNHTGTVQGVGSANGDGAGGLAGVASGTIENSNTSGSVTGIADVGLMVGIDNQATLSNDTLNPVFPPAGQLPPNYSPEVWGIASEANNGQPYLLWQASLPAFQGTTNSPPASSSPSAGASVSSPAISGNPLINQVGQMIIQEGIQLSSQTANTPSIGVYATSSSLGTLSPAAGDTAEMIAAEQTAFDAAAVAYSAQIAQINTQIDELYTELGEDIDEANDEEEALRPLFLDPAYEAVADEESDQIRSIIDDEQASVEAEHQALLAQGADLLPPSQDSSQSDNDDSSPDENASILASANYDDMPIDLTLPANNEGVPYASSGGSVIESALDTVEAAEISPASGGNENTYVSAAVTIFNGGFTPAYDAQINNDAAVSANNDSSQSNLVVSTIQIGNDAVSTIKDPAGAVKDQITDAIATVYAGKENAQIAKQLQDSGQTVGINEYAPKDANGNLSIHGTTSMGSRVQNIKDCNNDLNCIENITNQQMQNNSR